MAAGFRGAEDSLEDLVSCELFFLVWGVFWGCVFSVWPDSCSVVLLPSLEGYY